MKQNLALAVFAFLMAIAGATWFSVFVAPERTVPVADSSVVAIPAPVTAPVEDTVSSAPPVALAARADTVRPPSATPAKSEPEFDPKGAREVAKILITMKPKAAAEIIAKLTDDEVESIVRQLNAKQVATLLGVLPEERAAMLSRRLMTSAQGPGGGT